MNNYGLRKVPLIIFIPGLILFGVSGYYIGGALGDGKTVFDFYNDITEIINNPLKNYLNGKYTVIAILIMISAYIFIVFYYMVSGKNYMHGKEYGDAHFADNAYVNKCLSKPLDLKDHDSYEKVKKRRKKWFQRKRI